MSQQHIIAPDVLAALRLRQGLAQQYQLLLEDLQAGMRAQLLAATGQDVSQGQWQLDFDRGILTRQEEPSAPAASAAPALESEPAPAPDPQPRPRRS